MLSISYFISIYFANRFDEQFWGSDDEDDESNENTNQEKEDYGKGEQLEDKKLGAKDDKLNNEDDVMDNETKESKQKNDINEMNEPDYDEDHVRIVPLIFTISFI